jgi:hypothetical protein
VAEKTPAKRGGDSGLVALMLQRTVEGEPLFLMVRVIDRDIERVEDRLSCFAFERDRLSAPIHEHVLDRVGDGSRASEAALAELASRRPPQVLGEDRRRSLAQRIQLTGDLEDNLHCPGA